MDQNDTTVDGRDLQHDDAIDATAPHDQKGEAPLGVAVSANAGAADQADEDVEETDPVMTYPR